MTKRSLSIFVLVLVLSSVVACKRSSRDIAAKKGPLVGSPEYTVASQESLGKASEHIDEIFPGGPIDGHALFVKTCGACHQATGLGVPGAFPPLDGSPYVNGDNVERMASIMLYGVMGPIHVKGQLFQNVMTPFGGQLTDPELAAIATYVRSAWSNKSGPIDVSVFAKMRQKWGTRAQFQISELGEEQ